MPLARRGKQVRPASANLGPRRSASWPATWRVNSVGDRRQPRSPRPPPPYRSQAYLVAPAAAGSRAAGQRRRSRGEMIAENGSSVRVTLPVEAGRVSDKGGGARWAVDRVRPTAWRGGGTGRARTGLAAGLGGLLHHAPCRRAAALTVTRLVICSGSITSSMTAGRPLLHSSGWKAGANWAVSVTVSPWPPNASISLRESRGW